MSLLPTLRRGIARAARLHALAAHRIETGLAPLLIPTLARLVFAGVLLVYFWGSAVTKFGPGVFGFLMPSTGAYAQIFPVKAEAVLYDPTQFSAFETLVILAGMWAELLLPLLIVVGFFTRLAALGMIGFITVQSLTDIFGHMADPVTVGQWFDRASDALILDQRAFWVFLLVVLVLRGGGPLSVDRLIGARARAGFPGRDAVQSPSAA